MRDHERSHGITIKGPGFKSGFFEQSTAHPWWKGDCVHHPARLPLCLTGLWENCHAIYRYLSKEVRTSNLRFMETCSQQPSPQMSDRGDVNTNCGWKVRIARNAVFLRCFGAGGWSKSRLSKAARAREHIVLFLYCHFTCHSMRHLVS